MAYIIAMSFPDGSGYRERLSDEAARSGMPVSRIVRDAIDAHLAARGTRIDDFSPRGGEAALNLDVPDDTLKAIATTLVSERPTRAHAIRGRAYLLATLIEEEIVRRGRGKDLVHADEVRYGER